MDNPMIALQLRQANGQAIGPEIRLVRCVSLAQ